MVLKLKKKARKFSDFSLSLFCFSTSPNRQGTTFDESSWDLEFIIEIRNLYEKMDTKPKKMEHFFSRYG
ncbi:MAG: hypothetical protein D8M57_14170 [Candidatus Scalindua sp. AMX11]|nr:MAG: hypothetical protein DWQ00_09445 [Candidatus Scalindua sp.]TDE64239.1 MAG: hypothetical protein D8M57_14170 [Candidatus Scalindua sp. AMX11]